jgi:hypothetical protein
MSRVKKKLFATAVLLILEFMFLGFFLNRALAWNRQHISFLLSRVAELDAIAAKLDSVPKTRWQFALDRSGEVTSGSEAFLTASETVEVSRQSFIAERVTAEIFWLPKFLARSPNPFSIFNFGLSSEASSQR